VDRRRPHNRILVRIVTVTVASLCVLYALATPVAQALNVTTPTVTLSDPTAGATSTYTLSTYRTVGNENATGAELTFPAGFDLSSATLISPAGTLSRSGQTLTLTFTPLIEKNTDFSVVVGSIVNPAEGTYAMPNLTISLVTSNKGEPMPSASVAVGAVTIGQAVLSVTLPTQVVTFDASPEAAPPTQYVSLQVESSLPYTVTRAISGDVDLIGLSVTGEATGAKPAGTATMTDAYSANVPWTTDGGQTYTALVEYTVVQD